MNDLAKQLKRFVNAEMGDAYIAQHLNVDVNVVALARAGVYPVDEPKQSRQRTATKPRRPDSPVPRLRGDETVRELIERGLSAEKIRKRLGPTTTARQIQRFGKKLFGSSPPGTRVSEDAFGNVYPYVEECLRRLGRNPYWCVVCEETQPKRCIIHHTKYDGATIYDLVYACTSCNNSRMNRGHLPHQTR
jgi:hypothetical protein